MYQLNRSYIPVTYGDALHASGYMDIHTHTHRLLCRVHQYKFCKHDRTWIRLIVALSNIQLL